MQESKLYEQTIETNRIYEGKILNLRVDKVRLPNGREASREVVEHNGAVCVLPLGEDRTVAMVRQYRYPFGEAVLELPAGKLDGDEPHAVAASRELEEETGMRAAELVYLGEIRPSVAYSEERIHLYLARGLSQTAQRLDEDEFLDVETYPFDALVKMALENRLTDAKTVAALLKVKLLENKWAADVQTGQ